MSKEQYDIASAEVAKERLSDGSVVDTSGDYVVTNVIKPPSNYGKAIYEISQPKARKVRLSDGSVVEATKIGEGGGGVTIHNDLSGRDAQDSHPISAITDLERRLKNAEKVEVLGLQSPLVFPADTGTKLDLYPPDFDVLRDADDMLFDYQGGGIMYIPPIDNINAGMKLSLVFETPPTNGDDVSVGIVVKESGEEAVFAVQSAIFGDGVKTEFDIFELTNFYYLPSFSGPFSVGVNVASNESQVTVSGEIIFSLGGVQGSIQDTSQLFTNDSTESPSGSATTQKQVNIELTNQVAKCLELGYDNDEVDVLRQEVKTDSELISLFGIKSNDVITVDQSAVNYGIPGSYDVVFTVNNKATTLTVNIVNFFNLNESDLIKHTMGTDEEDVTSDFPINCKFDNVTITNTGSVVGRTVALNNSSTGQELEFYQKYGLGTLYEFVGKDPVAIKEVSGLFSNVASLVNGETLDVEVVGLDYKVHSFNELHQKWGFCVFESGQLLFIQRGFTYIDVKFSWIRNVNGKLKTMDSIIRFDNVQASKTIYSPLHRNEVLRTQDTLLLADVLQDRNNVEFLAISRFQYDEALETSDDIKCAIKSHTTENLRFGFGKRETGSKNTDYSTLKYEEVPISVNLRDVDVLGDTNKYIHRAFTTQELKQKPGTPLPEDAIVSFQASELDGEYPYKFFYDFVTTNNTGSDEGVYGAISINGVIVFEGKFTAKAGDMQVTSGNIAERFKASAPGSTVTGTIRVYLYKLGTGTVTLNTGGCALE